MEKLPALKIRQNKYTRIEDPYFKHAVSGAPIEEKTAVQIKYDSSYLDMKFDCKNNPRMDQNFYTKDNSALYNQEVFEIFLSQGSENPEAYIEIQLNPNDALYVSKITYHGQSDKLIEIELLDTLASGILHSVSKNNAQKSWSGRLRIPLSLLTDEKKGSKEVFRFNLFRVISKKDHLDPNWAATAENAIFSCWSSTYKKEPQFHVPDRFGFLYLE